LLSPKCRDDAAVLYAWCRRADDAIDECNAADAPEQLLTLRAELDTVYSASSPKDPTLKSFQDLVRKHAIPIHQPQALLAGFEMDLGTVRLMTIDELLLYSYRVAGVVGLMMCPVLGVRDPAALQHATDLGIAMQLTNICRDIKEDWLRQRLYVPEEILAAVGLGGLGNHLGQPPPDDARPGLQLAVRRVLDLADDYYASGDRGIQFLPPRAAVAIRTARKVYSAIGTGLRRRNCDALLGRVIVPRHEKLRLIMQALVEELVARLTQRFTGVSFRSSRANRSGAGSVQSSEGLFQAAMGARA
jgi:phytoene synthase